MRNHLCSAALVAVAAAASVLVSSPSANAQATIVWNFPDTTGLPNVNTSSLTASAITFNNNFGTTAAPIASVSVSTGYTQADNGGAAASGTNNAGLAANIGAFNATTSPFFEFTLTAPTGFQARVTEIAFGARSTPTGPQAYSVRSSTSSFGTEIAGATLANDSVWRYQNPTAFIVEGATGGAVTLRIYGFNGAGSPGSGTINWRIDDLAVTASAIQVGGTTAPEPGALALFAGALLPVGMAVIRRKKTA